MHSLGIVHRDLKLENILMHDLGGGDMEVKIADFGLSCILPLGEDGYDPDHSCKRKKYDKCDDMWGTRVSAVQSVECSAVQCSAMLVSHICR